MPFIARSIHWHGAGRWIEPFVGSGAVAFNIAPPRALLADTNPHLIALYRGLQRNAIDGVRVREHLEREGARLAASGEAHYYFVRDRFNALGDTLDFIFLSRACFNGMMRFNQRGGFNVPFCRKPQRFHPAHVTKIVNQIEWARRVIDGKDWHFAVQDWRTTLGQARAGDLVYCDPPYAGRHADYFNGFSEDDAIDLAKTLRGLPAEFALSNWLENKFRRNSLIDRWFAANTQRTADIVYHVGATQALRHAMTEVLILSDGLVAPVDAAS